MIGFVPHPSSHAFYFYFKDMHELALVAIDEMGDEPRCTLTDLRSCMREPLEASRATTPRIVTRPTNNEN